MTSLTITDLYGAVRGRGNPITGRSTSDFIREADEPPFPPADDSITVSLPAQEGWFNKTLQYRHVCMMNIADLNRQLTDGKYLSNRELLERRKEFLLSEVNVCNRMLCLFTKELN